MATPLEGTKKENFYHEKYMNKKIIIFIFGLLSIMAFAYFFINRNEATGSIPLAWKEYRNIYNYSVKYPADWLSKESAQIIWIRDSSQNALFKVNVFPNYDDKDNNTQKVREYVASLERFVCDANDEGPCIEIEAAIKKSGGWQLQGSQEITLDSMRGVQYQYKKTGNEFSELYYIPKQGAIYEIELTNLSNTEKNSLNTVLKQILDTFRFPK